MPFNVGDVVQLKSGGPKMTVRAKDEGDGEIMAVWFAGAKQETGYFPTDTLVLVKET